ncbi:33_t:CDS:2, partial [Cetraspora pellucida]
EDMMDLKSEAANKLDMVLEVSEMPSQGNDKYKVKFDKLKQNLDDDNNQNSEKKNSEKSNDKEEDANMIENDYEEEVDKMHKGKINYEAEEKVDEMYRGDIEKADQIDKKIPLLIEEAGNIQDAILLLRRALGLPSSLSVNYFLNYNTE